MTRYHVVVGRRIYQFTSMVVTEETREKAEAAAIAKAKDPQIAWDANEAADQNFYFIEKIKDTTP